VLYQFYRKHRGDETGKAGEKAMMMRKGFIASFQWRVAAFLSRLDLGAPPAGSLGLLWQEAERVCALPSFAICENFFAKGLDKSGGECADSLGSARQGRNALFLSCQPLFGTFCGLFEYL